MNTATEKVNEVSATTPIATKPKAKRGRPRKNAAATATASSLTRTTRRVKRTKSTRTPKAAAAQAVAKPATLLNRLLNISIVVAVFAIALAIQRIVPTAPVTAPKVEALQQEVAAPVTEPVVAETPAPVVTAPEVPAATPAKRTTAAAPKKSMRHADYTSPYTSGGTFDLDNESARQHYLKNSSLATRSSVDKSK